MKLFRRCPSAGDLELDSSEAWTPLMNEAEKPLRSQKALTAAINDDDLKPRWNINTGDLRRITSLSKPVRSPLSRQQTPSETPHHIFNTKHKRYMVYIVSFAGLFSRLSSNIYFPALGSVAKVRLSPIREAHSTPRQNYHIDHQSRNFTFPIPK